MAGPDLTENPLGDPDDTTEEPIALRSETIKTWSQEQKRERETDPKDADGVVRAIGRPVGLDHAEHAVELPVDEEDEEQMVRVPEALKVRPTLLLRRKPDHGPQGEPHDPSSDSGAGCEVG